MGERDQGVDRPGRGETARVAPKPGGGGGGGGPPARAARLKGGSYTVEGPLAIGAALAAGPPSIRQLLGRYGRPLGLAFQLRDDLEDGEAAPGVDRATVRRLVDEAEAALDGTLLPADAHRALGELAELIAR